MRVHGGLNYSASCSGAICHVPGPGESDDVWWQGLDCGHGFDVTPAFAAMFRDWPLIRDQVYRNMEYVRAQVRSLAEQARAAC